MMIFCPFGHLDCAILKYFEVRIMAAPLEDRKAVYGAIKREHVKKGNPTYWADQAYQNWEVAIKNITMKLWKLIWMKEKQCMVISNENIV